MPKPFPEILYVARVSETGDDDFEIRHGPTDTMLEDGDAVARYQLLDTGKAEVVRQYVPSAKGRKRK